MDSMQQKWEKLTLADDFMFGKVMSDPKLCAEMLRRIFPDLDIGKIKIVETQKTLKQALHVRGVRFDVLTSTARSIFDVEAQKRKLKDLCRRPRSYHIAVGYDALNKKSLKKSGAYEDLPNTYVIFICTFDLFNKGRHIYTFRNFCAEDREIGLDDGAYTVFLNTKGKLDDISPELKNFLNFVDKNKVVDGDTFIKTLDERIKETKNNTKWRNEYMLLLTREDEISAEAREEERERVAVDMLKKSLPLQLIEEISKLSEDVIRRIATARGLVIS